MRRWDIPRRAALAVATVFTVLLTAVSPAVAGDDPGKRNSARAAATFCDGWHRLDHGVSGSHAVVEPGAPWHVRLGGDTDGYQNFMFCDYGYNAGAGKRKVAFYSNASKQYLTWRNGEVVASGTEPDGPDYWWVCALDTTWVEISYFTRDAYLTRNSANYLTTVSGPPGGEVLWQRYQFGPISDILPYC
ncbi:hypothetical protein Aph02nite_23930 [Actinoplanes philippinensis]|uniref:Secreted protein n=1 Tax=Actinoplanes philippinensis TaxID=35752 RepID=A0A1I2G043_9ACTN|nr:hypothetical protein [Actinoplanes philippinensis]GIE76443.1 hypothetical protein Aph02nite_23930 [Actinoplanes philippinensis]SFF10340.1 hypothetical protein SAMN05421541_10654 [Actinoplanes philippinensis]